MGLKRRLAGARREFIAIQKTLVRRAQEEIRSSIGGADPELVRYRRAYRRELRGYRSVASRERLIAGLAGADIVFQGDYHTLAQSQNAAVRILLDLIKRPRPVTIALEMVMANGQAPLDRYLAGEIDEEEFLDAIDYDRTWGFEWRHYRPLLHLARTHGLRVIGMNTNPPRGRGHLRRRDLASAEVLADEIAAHPDRRVYVLDGDLHVAKGHLPGAVDRALHARGVRGTKRAIVFQNSETIYWALAAAGRESVDVVRLDDEAWCIFTATPLVKLRSYLNWEERVEELAPRVQPAWRVGVQASSELADQFYGFTRTIADFLGLEGPFEGFAVYTGDDLDFIERLRHRGGFSEREIADVKRQILAGESCFIPKGNIVYLSSLSLNHAAEEAAHFVNAVVAGWVDRRRSRFEDFYVRTIREALAFFGSRIINPRRACYAEADLQAFLLAHRRRRLRPEYEATRRIARYVLQHKRCERAWLSTGRVTRLRRIYELDVDTHLGVTHVLGYTLGARLHEAVMAGRVDRAWVRALFQTPFEGAREAFRAYLELVQRVRPP